MWGGWGVGMVGNIKSIIDKSWKLNFCDSYLSSNL
jgi:hypothetical protein